MNQVKGTTLNKIDNKTINNITKQIVEQKKEDSKDLQKVALMSYLSS